LRTVSQKLGLVIYQIPRLHLSFLIHHIQSAPPNSTVVLQACESHFVLQVLKARGAQQAQVPADQILGKLWFDRPSTHTILQYWLVVSYFLFSIIYGIIIPLTNIFKRGRYTTVLSRTFLHTILLGIGRERAILDQKNKYI
jgi:hypothetical protein